MIRPWLNPIQLPIFKILCLSLSSGSLNGVGFMKHTHKHVRRETKKENKYIPPRSKVTPKLLKFSTSFPLTRSKSSAFTLNKANVEWPTSTFASTTNFPTSWAVACAFNYQNLVFRSHLKVFCLFVFNIKKKKEIYNNR